VNTADRVDLIRGLADLICDGNLRLEDSELTLRQFGFRLNDREHWDGSYRSIIIDDLTGGTDDALTALYEYLAGEPASGRLDPGDLPWEPGTVRVFISHTHPNAALMNEASKYLLNWRIDTFVAHVDIEPNREWERTIETALSTCDALAALITPDFAQSNWCDQEIGYCLGRQIPVVPARLGADPHGFIAKFQAVTLDPNPHPTHAADTMFRGLLQHPRLGDLLARPVVRRFAATGSFDGARNNFPLLARVPAEAWDRDMVEMVERAVEENSQLKHAVLQEPIRGYPLPEAVEQLLRPIRQRLGLNDQPKAQSGDDNIF
jgi:TIR domain-containing protein